MLSLYNSTWVIGLNDLYFDKDEYLSYSVSVVIESVNWIQLSYLLIIRTNFIFNIYIVFVIKA